MSTVIASQPQRRHTVVSELTRIGRWVLIGGAVLIAAGIAYQAAAAESDRRNYPPPGDLIDVGGFAMHIHCLGAGGPTVVLEASAGGFSPYWAWVQADVGGHVRVCAYDRAGHGWSEADPEPESPSRTVHNLNALLTGAGVAGPYVLVGHSKGGLIVRAYAAQYPADVAGILLLDSAHPDQFRRHPDWLDGETSMLPWMPVIDGLLRLGAGHLYFAAGGQADFGGLPPRQRAEIGAVWSSPAYWATQAASMRLGSDTFFEESDLGPLGDLPLSVISSATELESGWGLLQGELATLSTDSRWVIVPESNHMSLVFDSEDARQVSAEVVALIGRAGSP